MSQYKTNKNSILVNEKIDNTTLFRDKKFILLCFCLLFFSYLIHFINNRTFHFIGNNYLNSYHIAYLTTYSLINLIASKLLPELNFLKIRFLLILQVIFSALVIIITTNAVQLTPYVPIDHTLIKYEFFPLEKHVFWTRNHHLFQQVLWFFYQSLNTFMFSIPILMSIFNKAKEVNQFCLFVLSSVAIGFGFYFFYPSCGPASVFNPSIFFDVQHANHIKFWEIHHYQIPTTYDGGLIAFPSFHVIWAWACTRSFRKINKILYAIMFIWFVFLTLSCFLLGWHYSIDIIGSLMIILILEKLFNMKKNPR